MSNSYHEFLSSLSGMEGHPPTSPDEVSFPTVHGAPLPPSPATYQNLDYFSGLADQTGTNAPKPQKGRKKSTGVSGAGVEHVKHRRTRSGCFMCRSRRVKCDEARPICERCRKGNRECVYPEAKGSSRQAGRSKDAVPAQSPSPNSSNEEFGALEMSARLETIIDEDESVSPPNISATAQTILGPTNNTAGKKPKAATWGVSESSSQDGANKSSPAFSNTTLGSMETPLQPSDLYLVPGEKLDWSHLPLEHQALLNFYVENITNFHYCTAVDSDDFFSKLILKAALYSETLLYAVIGFAAYHVTLKNPDGNLQDFLQYYNMSVNLLLDSLRQKNTDNVTTLMTILQLATIEEYLGDWIGIMGHQKAALEIMYKIFTPETVMQTPVGRACIGWYTRFDSFVGLMGGFPVSMPRSWFTAMTSFRKARVLADPDAHHWKYDSLWSQLRLITYDMSILYFLGREGKLSREEFAEEHDKISATLEAWKDEWDPFLLDPAHVITDFPNRPPTNPDDIVDPYKPGVIYKFPFFLSTTMWTEWHSICLMHQLQAGKTTSDDVVAETQGHGYAICQTYAALERWPQSPKGVLILLSACLNIGALFIEQDARHRMWLRRRFALFDTSGYIFPPKRRERMAVWLDDPSCLHWWLPNDEGLTPIIQKIRNFVDERNAAATTSEQQSLREVRQVFEKLNIS